MYFVANKALQETVVRSEAGAFLCLHELKYVRQI